MHDRDGDVARCSPGRQNGVLYCTVLYCTVLYCTVLYCTVLYCIGLVQYGSGVFKRVM